MASLLLFAVACGTPATTPKDGGTTADSGPVVETCTTDSKAIALEAHYAIQAKLSVNVKVPSDCAGDSCILDKDAKAGLLLLADLTQTGLMATVTGKPCQITIPPVALKGQPMPTQLTASDTLVQSVGSITSSATLSGADTCSSFTSLPLKIVLGASLANPATDALPKFDNSKTPPIALCAGNAGTLCNSTSMFDCICDQEGDAKLGATVEASGVPALDDVDRVYLALRTVVTLSGTVFPPSLGQATAGQRIKGQISNLTLDQSPVGCHRGASNMDCDAATTNSVAQLNPKVVQSVNTQSTFVAMPVPSGYTCEQLIANAATLFAGQ